MKDVHNKQTRAKIAACAALGLSYWADHPATGCMWAVDDHQQAHVVRWYRKAAQVALQSTGAPHRVIDYNSRVLGRVTYRDQYSTFDDGARVAVTA